MKTKSSSGTSKVRKYTNALRYRISIMMLRKLKRESDNPALYIEFSGHFYYPRENWVLIPEETYKQLTGEHHNGTKQTRK